MGARGRREKKSAKKTAAARANARRPRGRWANTAEREQLERAKAELRTAITGGGADRLAAIILDRETPAELFLAAFKIAADRAGLPAQAQVQAGANVGMALLKAPAWLGWPGLQGLEPADDSSLAARLALPPGTPVVRKTIGAHPKLVTPAQLAKPEKESTSEAAAVRNGSAPEPIARPAAVPAASVNPPPKPPTGGDRFTDLDRALFHGGDDDD